MRNKLLDRLQGYFVNFLSDLGQKYPNMTHLRTPLSYRLVKATVYILSKLSDK